FGHPSLVPCRRCLVVDQSAVLDRRPMSGGGEGDVDDDRVTVERVDEVVEALLEEFVNVRADQFELRVHAMPPVTLQSPCRLGGFGFAMHDNRRYRLTPRLSAATVSYGRRFPRLPRPGPSAWSADGTQDATEVRAGDEAGSSTGVRRGRAVEQDAPRAVARRGLSLLPRRGGCGVPRRRASRRLGGRRDPPPGQDRLGQRRWRAG